MSKVQISIGATTDKGNIKTVNQDAFLCKIGSSDSNEFGLFVVCDGLGGLECGEIASSTIIKNFNKWWDYDIKEIMKSSNIENIIISSLENIINKSNKELIEYSKKMNYKMGSTTTVLFIMNKKYYISHIGDSRIYLIDKKVRQLTLDHTQYEMLRKQGKYEELKNARKNVLTQCVGVNEALDIQSHIGTIKNNTNFLICSDGFYHKMSEREIYKRFKSRKLESDSLQEECENLVDDIKQMGERDNITLITIKVKVKNVISYSKIKKYLTVNKM